MKLQFEDLKKAADRCASELGAIDFVIAGAAGNFVAPISALTPNGFKSVIDIDTIGTFNTIKATMPHLVASASRNPNPSPTGQTGGRIIYVSATFHYTGVPLQAHVSAAKAGVDSLMASVAIEYGPLGITSNVISFDCCPFALLFHKMPYGPGTEIPFLFKFGAAWDGASLDQNQV